MIVLLSGAKLMQNSQGKRMKFEILDTYKELISAVVVHVGSAERQSVPPVVT